MLTALSYLEIETAVRPSVTYLDPAQMSLDEFGLDLFDRPIHRSDEEQRFMVRRSADDFDDYEMDHEAFVRLVTEVYRRFGEVTGRYSVEQVDQGIWYLIGYVFMMDSVLAQRVSVEAAAENIRAAYHLFADYVQRVPGADVTGGFFMFWDEYSCVRREELRPVLLEALEHVLALDHEECQRAALHGLNHLHPFPGVQEAIDDFLERSAGRLSQDLYDYARWAREGKAG